MKIIDINLFNSELDNFRSLKGEIEYSSVLQDKIILCCDYHINIGSVTHLMRNMCTGMGIEFTEDDVTKMVKTFGNDVLRYHLIRDYFIKSVDSCYYSYLRTLISAISSDIEDYNKQGITNHQLGHIVRYRLKTFHDLDKSTSEIVKILELKSEEVTEVVLNWCDLSEDIQDGLQKMWEFNRPNNGCYYDLDKSGEFNNYKFSSLEYFDDYIIEEHGVDYFSESTIELHRKIFLLVNAVSDGSHKSVTLNYSW